MQEALDAIEDIKEALNEYGSDMVLNVIEKGEYNPTSGASKTVTPVNIKSIINKQPSSFAQAKADEDNKLKAYEFSITTYTDQDIDKDDNIEFNGSKYDILIIIPSILQNTIIKYEILIKK